MATPSALNSILTVHLVQVPDGRRKVVVHAADPTQASSDDDLLYVAKGLAAILEARLARWEEIWPKS